MRGRTYRLAALLVPALLLTGLLAFQLPAAQAQNIGWVRQFGSPQHDAAVSVAVDPTGHVYVAGWTDGALPGQTSAGGPRDSFVRKYGPDGTETWTRQFGTPRTDLAMAVAVDPARHVYVVGQVDGALPGQSSAGEFDAYVRKYDPDGGAAWTRQFGGPGTDAAAGLVVEPGGDVYVAGWVYGALPGQSPTGQFDAFLRRYDSNGAESWTRQFGTPDHDRAVRASLVTTGDVEVAAGGSRGNTRRDAFVHRFGPGGAAGPSRRLQAADTDDVRGVAMDPPGNIHAVGQTDPDHGHAFVRKSDPSGSLIWERDLHLGDDETIVVDVAVDPAGDVYVAGQVAADVFVRKYDRNGRELWTSRLGTPDNDIASALIVDPTGTVYLVGWTNGAFSGQRSAGLSDAFLAQLR